MPKKIYPRHAGVEVISSFPAGENAVIVNFITFWIVIPFKQKIVSVSTVSAWRSLIWHHLCVRKIMGLPFAVVMESIQLHEYLRAKTAGEVMSTNIVTVQEDAPIDEAIRLMLERAIKRLPVVDSEGKYKGMVSRDSLLRAGFASTSA